MRVSNGLALLVFAAACSAVAGLEDCRALRVFDGDTLDVRCGAVVERVRLLRIDTPERDERGYAAARRALHELVRGKRLRLEPENLGGFERDVHGRLLAYVYAEGVLANVEMVRQGWSRFYVRYGRGRLADAFEQAERDARR
jgi:micrococcal nuclease